MRKTLVCVFVALFFLLPFGGAFYYHSFPKFFEVKPEKESKSPLYDVRQKMRSLQSILEQ